MLTEQQVLFWKTFGYLVFRNVFPQDEIDQIRRDHDDVMAEERGGQSFNGKETQTVLWFVEQRPSLARLADDDRVYNKVEQLLGPGFIWCESDGNYYVGDTAWHSDGYADKKYMSMKMAFYLDPVAPETGCLRVIPGSHKAFLTCIGETPDDHYRQSLKKQEYGVPDEDSLAELAHKHGIVAPTGKPGSVVIFDCNTMHGSNGNITPFPRANAFMVYNAVSNRLTAPFGVDKPRPEFIAARGEPEAITPVTGLLMEEALA